VKVRPAVVLATMPGEDFLICQITSQPVADSYATAITRADFEWGGLQLNSNVRANILMTVNSKLTINTVGRLKKDATDKVVANVARLLGIR
jgi:mRNA interferase MazF